MALRAWLASALLVLASSAYAEPGVVLRFGSAAPEGTAWAREARAFGREVEAQTSGRVRVRFILGGIAGDEFQMPDRVRREQLDGIASGGPLCARLAPALQVTRLIGLFRDRAETNYVLGRLKSTLDEQFDRAGYVNLFETLLGPDMVFTREPVRTMADLARQRLWIWDLEVVFREGLTSLGIKTVPLPLDAASSAYREGRTDGFSAIPIAALAFQWSAQVRYLSELQVGFLSGCLILAHRSLDALPLEAQSAVRTAAAKFQARLEYIGNQQDHLLTSGLFAHQGITRVPVSAELRRSFEERARSVRDHFDEKLVPAAQRKRVEQWLEEYRHKTSSR
jgi:TRAP-type C4-dicarboxylate transport system substrate-binding protein